MLFSSLTFLFGFLPVILICYYLLPKAMRNHVLLLFSFLFYAWGGAYYAIVLIGSIVVNYLVSKQLEQSSRPRQWLTIGILFNIGILMTFKYLDFFIENTNAILGLTGMMEPLPLTGILLPLGISFFTFQEMSMLWDIYRNPDSKSTSLLNTALYVSLFPQLVAGPIVRYDDVIDQIKERRESVLLFRSGIQKFILGLFKKVIIANNCAILADGIMDAAPADLSAPVAWLGIIAYALQIYFDFSGYSDMAIGLCRMFGFKILENFDFPYISRSIKEFWRRWHISLSSWFRDYVYIPLGGNRKGERRLYINLIIVFLLTGFWHGATWSFVFWGVFHGSFLIIERLGLGRILAGLPSIISWLYTMIVVLVGWVFFRIESFTTACHYLGSMIGLGSSTGSVSDYLNTELIGVLAVALLASSTVIARTQSAAAELSHGAVRYILYSGRDVALLAMLFISVLYINAGSYSPFIYFRF